MEDCVHQRKGRVHSGIRKKKTIKGKSWLLLLSAAQEKVIKLITESRWPLERAMVLWAEDSPGLQVPQDAWPALLRFYLHQISHKLSLQISYRDHVLTPAFSSLGSSVSCCE